jgi:hypothetical protein
MAACTPRGSRIDKGFEKGWAMLKRVLIGGTVLILVLAIGLFVWVRAVLGTDAVRTTLATQLTKALGQAVEVGTVGATIYPRVTVNLGDVSIGQPVRIKIGTLHVGTDLRALLSRRIEHASLNLTGARIELPLPDFAVSTRAPEGGGAPTGSPVEIVSIDEVVLRGVEIVSGGRTLKGDVEVVPQGNGFLIRKATLGADAANIEITGQITDLAGPVGELDLTAGLSISTRFSSSPRTFPAAPDSEPTSRLRTLPRRPRHAGPP